MLDMAMYPAVGQEAIQMELLVVILCSLHRFDQRRVVEKLPFADRFRNPGQILVHDAACADVQMADFGVAHLPFRQTYRFA